MAPPPVPNKQVPESLEIQLQATFFLEAILFSKVNPRKLCQETSEHWASISYFTQRTQLLQPLCKLSLLKCCMEPLPNYGLAMRFRHQPDGYNRHYKNTEIYYMLRYRGLLNVQSKQVTQSR